MRGSRAHDEERGEGDGSEGDDSDEERIETPLRPLDLRPAHRLNDLLPLVLRLRRLPVRRCLQRREEDEGACDPEEGEDCESEGLGRSRHG